MASVSARSTSDAVEEQVALESVRCVLSVLSVCPNFMSASVRVCVCRTKQQTQAWLYGTPHLDAVLNRARPLSEQPDCAEQASTHEIDVAAGADVTEML